MNERSKTGKIKLTNNQEMILGIAGILAIIITGIVVGLKSVMVSV